MSIEQDPWSEIESANLFYGFTANNILTKTDDNNFLLYSAIWQGKPVVGETTFGPWEFLHDDQSRERVTEQHWDEVHPGFSRVDVTTNTPHELSGTYNGKEVRWSRSKNSFIYRNNHRVDFSKHDDSDEEQVSSLLEASLQSVERSRSKLTPETPTSSLPGAFNAPEPVTPTPPQPTTSTSKGKAPVKTQQPTPPVSKSTPAMSTAKLVGTPPEQFDGSASKAESFLSALQNYYYLNETLFSDESRRVAAALSHFKVGTPAGEWARDKQNAALSATRVYYGTWNDFLDDFKKHFVPVQTEQQAMNAIWTVHMKNRPFHEWYQEWSTYASRSGANDATKMYAFRQALPRGLNDKLSGVTPVPTTLTELVNKARDFDQQYRLWAQPDRGNASSFRPKGPRMRGTTIEDPSINHADANIQEFKQKKLSKEERDKRTANNECYYCGHAGHFARECRSRPAGRGRGRGQSRGQSRFNKPVRTRATETGEEAPSENPETSDAATVSRIYHDQENHFKVLESLPADVAEDF
jgi:hypothetical protein